MKKAPEAKTVKNARTRLREKTKASAVSRLIRKAREHGFRKTNAYSVGYMYFTTADRDVNPDEDNDEEIKRLQNRTSGFVVSGTQYIPLSSRDGVRNAKFKTIPFMESLVNRKVTNKFDKNLSKQVFKLLQGDALVKSDLFGSVNASFIYSAPQQFDSEDEPLRETSNVSIWNYGHETRPSQTQHVRQ